MHRVLWDLQESSPYTKLPEAPEPLSELSSLGAPALLHNTPSRKADSKGTTAMALGHPRFQRHKVRSSCSNCQGITGCSSVASGCEVQASYPEPFLGTAIHPKPKPLQFTQRPEVTVKSAFRKKPRVWGSRLLIDLHPGNASQNWILLLQGWDSASRLALVASRSPGTLTHLKARDLAPRASRI